MIQIHESDSIYLALILSNKNTYFIIFFQKMYLKLIKKSPQQKI